jgi:putative transposase
MSNHIRPRTPAATIYFTTALQQRGSDLLILEIERLRQAVRVTRTERPFQIKAWVVLPDHLHTIWALPEGDNDFATRWRLIKSRFSASLPAARLPQNRIRLGMRGIWQSGFGARSLHNLVDFDLHMRHCWLDPLRHGLVDRPEDWPYSSFNPAASQRAAHRPAASMRLAG